MKKQYVTPMVNAEAFEANEYVAACYSIACSINGKNTMDQSNWSSKEYGQEITHGGSCHESSRNYIFSGDTLTVNAGIREYSSDQGYITGKIDKVVSGGVAGPVGDTVYWYTTSGDGKRRWNHMGTVVASDVSHPNRS